jgi:AraC-like DNA-binding protein
MLVTHDSGVYGSAVRNRGDAAGLPAPADLRAWCRLFMAGRLLDEPGRTVESVALQLEFTTGSALRNLIKRRTGLAPYMLRNAGGLQYLIVCFHTLCAERRAAHRGRAPSSGEQEVVVAVGPLVPDVPDPPAARVAEPAPRRPRSRRATAASSAPTAP